jgi:hypothetical protein
VSRTTDLHVEKITKLAAETAVQIALEYLEKEKQKQQKVKRDRRLRNTKLLLKHYRSFKRHCGDVKTELEKLNDPEFLNEIDTEKFAIESDKRSKERTLAMVRFIDKMLEVYRIMCERSGRPEEIRKYKTIEMMYISDEKLTAEQIAEEHEIDTRTVYKDINKASNALSALIFGVDGMRMTD